MSGLVKSGSTPQGRHRALTALYRGVCMLLVVSAAVPAAAQTTLGAIRGTLFDPQHNVVPGATVVVSDESTNVTREVQTDVQGLFEVPNLRSGTYTP